MSSLLCSSSCGALGNPPSSYQDLCEGNTFRRYGYPFYALIRCDQALPDPTDLAAWGDLVTNNTLRLSPCGKLDIPTPSFETSSDVNVCGGDVVLKTTYNITFSTYQTADDLSDVYYFKDLIDAASGTRIIWFDCDGNVYMSGEYVDFVRGTSAVAPTGSPGFQYTINANPHPTEGDGNYVKWEIGLQIELGGDEMICPVQVPGLLETLQQ